MITIPEKINKISKIILAVFLLLILGKTIQTYYSSLAQYGTGDQTQFSLPRFQKFLISPDSVNLNDCAHLSYIIVAIPGHMLEKHLNKTHKPQEKLFGDIQYTEIIAYSLFQVTFCLLLLFYCIYLIGALLKLNLRKDYLYYLIIAIVILNYPTLKGDIKILKYDALSIVCAISSILNYLVYKSRGKKKFLIFSAIFSGLAFIEKDTSISTIFLVIFIEIFDLAMKPGKSDIITKNIVTLIFLYIGIFFMTIFSFIPQLWYNPSNINVLFKGLNDYFQVLNFGVILGGFVLLFVLILLARNYKFKRPINSASVSKSPSKNKKSNPVIKNAPQESEGFKQEYYFGLLAFSLIIFISGILYQKNNVYDMSTINSQYYSKIKSEHLFVSKPMAFVSISTLDKSIWITRIKVLYNSIRIFLYVTPEIILFIFFFAPLLLLILHKKGFREENTSLLLLFLFPSLMITAYAYLLAPFEPKYNILSYFLYIVFSCFILVEIIRKVVPNFGQLIILGIALLMIRPAVLADPAYFGYKNYFRSVEVENNEFLDLNKYNWWMWLGWGETTYPIFKYIDKTTTGKQKILLDYTSPFAENPRLKVLYNPYFRMTYADTASRTYLKFELNEFKGFINYYYKDTVNFLLVSKNVANRGIIGNFIVRNFREKAVYVDKIGGVEYGWLFKVKDLMKAVNNPM